MRSIIHLSERDLNLLGFLFKYKVASSALVMGRYFSSCASHTAYKRLLALEKANFIEARSDHSGKNYLWMLKKKGFDVIKSSLPELAEIGFKSENIVHDYLCTLLSLSLETKSEDKKSIVISEQQLRRFDENVFPKWLPSPKDHRPDGYIRTSEEDNQKLIALEVELNIKKASRYLSTLYFFETYSDKIDHILWVLPSHKTGERLSRILKDSGISSRSLCPKDREDYHLFISLVEFEKAGMDTKVFNLDQNEITNLKKLVGNRHGITTESDPFMDMRILAKSPHKLRAYKDGVGLKKIQQTYKSLIF
ncbi:MAG: hypothetical protein CME65_16210 [Halobacteriovoraceae bacterium]|nr:hypothetical protein [Halobacteriovoraceae bacterium]|tara:strand:+ start:2926 stop:3846 length:921 start_codon:yes stop_codon:yes gene_type:complete